MSESVSQVQDDRIEAQSGTVLIVDDDLVNMDSLLGRMRYRLKCKVEAADSIEAALSFLSRR